MTRPRSKRPASCAAPLVAVVLAATVASPAKVALAQEKPAGPPTVGHAMPYAVVPELEATLGDGEVGVWTEMLYLPGAKFLKPHYVGLDLAPGDELVVRTASGRVVEVLTGRGPKDRSTFWGLSGRGDRLVLELSHRAVYDAPPFRIDQVVAGDVDPLGGVGEKSICAPADFDDAICFSGDFAKWANVLASVGVMAVMGDPDANAIFCSGANVSPDNYVLTNEHCLGSGGSCTIFGHCDDAEFVFKYYRTGCNDGSPPVADWESFYCDEVVVSSPCVTCDVGPNDLDFALASVLGDPASIYGWVQPDPVPLTDGEAVYIIQHPNFRPHEITAGSGADVDVDSAVIRYYGTLDTEGGSSGSPILRESDDKMVGLHHCGGCVTPAGNRGIMMSEIFPHIAPYVIDPTMIFSDGFESGDLRSWSVTVN